MPQCPCLRLWWLGFGWATGSTLGELRACSLVFWASHFWRATKPVFTARPTPTPALGGNTPPSQHAFWPRCATPSRVVSQKVHAQFAPLVSATGSQLGASLALALPALWFMPEALPSTQAWASLIILGVVCTGIAYILYFRLVNRAGPARALTVTF